MRMAPNDELRIGWLGKEMDEQQPEGRVENRVEQTYFLWRLGVKP